MLAPAFSLPAPEAFAPQDFAKRMKAPGSSVARVDAYFGAPVARMQPGSGGAMIINDDVPTSAMISWGRRSYS